MPTVLNIIEKSRKGAAKTSADSYIKAIETYILTSEMDSSMEVLDAGKIYSVQKINGLVEVKGTKPSDGTVQLDNKKRISQANLIIDGYIIKYDGNHYTIVGQGKGLFVSKESIILEKTKSETIIATIEPKQEIIWKSSNESIATVEDGLVTGIAPGKAVITVTSSDKKYQKEIKVEVTNLYLSSVAQVGDYVAYDAGVWSETKDRPTIHGQFGGYKSGTNKGNSIAWCYQEEYKTNLQGWRIINIDGNIIRLIHAGQPECYYHSAENENSNESINNLNNRATQYINNTYASSAYNLSITYVLNLTGGSYDASSNDLINTHDFYWLASSYNANRIYKTNNLGLVGSHGSASFGIRPIVVLKAGIKTNGKGKDVFGQDAWTLVAS